MFVTPLCGFRILSPSLAWTVLTSQHPKINKERLLIFSSLYSSRSRKAAMRDQSTYMEHMPIHDVADVSSISSNFVGTAGQRYPYS